MAPDGQLQKSSALDSAEPESLNIKNSVQTTANGGSLDYDCGRGHKVARSLAPSSTCAAMLPLGSYPILRRLLSGAAILFGRLSCTFSQPTYTTAHNCALTFVRPHPQLVGTNRGSLAPFPSAPCSLAV